LRQKTTPRFRDYERVSRIHGAWTINVLYLCQRNKNRLLTTKMAAANSGKLYSDSQYGTYSMIITACDVSRRSIRDKSYHDHAQKRLLHTAGWDLVVSISLFSHCITPNVNILTTDTKTSRQE